MILTTLIFTAGAYAAPLNPVECLASASQTKTCCNEPTADACLDAEGKALTAKLKGFQASLNRQSAGLHDASASARVRASAMQASADLNQRASRRCEEMIKACVDLCGRINSGDAKSAGQRCQDLAKVAADLHDQATRDEAQAKRLRRGAK